MATLVRIDRNGTKYWEDYTCEKCNGKGYIPCFDYVEGGICFDCGGTGKGLRKRKEYTPEYKAKLEQRRFEREKKKATEFNKDNFSRYGLAEDGSCYVVMGNSYDIKEELKEAGARFCYHLGWYFAEDNDSFDTKHFEIEDIACCSNAGLWYIDRDWANNYLAPAISKAQEEYASSKSASEYIGNVGDKISADVCLKNIGGYSTDFGFNNVYTMEDSNGNIFAWHTSSCALCDFDIGDSFTIAGKVKNHNEYKGIKQTVLTRCKVA